MRRVLSPVLTTLMVASLLTVSVTLGPVAEAGAAENLEQLWRIEVGQTNDSSPPTIGDVDGDGIDEIVFGTLDGYIYVYEGDGTLVWSKPAILAGQTSPSAISSAPVVADLDNDGDVEIVVGVGSIQRPNQQGGVVALDHNGNRIWSHQGFDTFNSWTGTGIPDGYTEGVYSSPAVGDIDGDGYLDIVFGGWDHRIWALDRNGGPVSGFPFTHYDTTWGSPALYDIDGDGRDEIYIGGDASIGLDFTHEGGRYRVLDWQQGVVVERFPAIERAEIFQSSSVLGDINNDGRMDVIVGGSAGLFPAGADVARQVWAFHADDGSMLPGFPVQLPNRVFSTPALGDVDGDGAMEIVVTTMNEGTNNGLVTVIENNGTIKYAVDALQGEYPGAVVSYMASPIIIDGDGDGDLDIVASSNIFTFVVEGSSGVRLDGGMLNPAEAWAGAGAPLAADFGPLGWRLIVPTFLPPSGAAILTAYSLPDQPGGIWPMWRGYPDHSAAPAGSQNATPVGCGQNSNPALSPSQTSATGYWVLHRNGSVDAINVEFFGDLASRGIVLPAGVWAAALTKTSSGNGYWILDSNGIVYAFGDAVDHGSMAGIALNAPVISMAALPTGNGYWLLGADGGVFSFGAAGFHGSTGALALKAPIISMAPTASGQGYWLLASDGGVFSFGDAAFHGSTGALALAAPVISMAVSPDGSGYWLLGGDGGVFSFSVDFYGSIPGMGLCSAPSARELRPTSTGRGYFALGNDGSIIAFGDAYYRGRARLDGDPVDLAVRG
ncbi:MAG: VCBS repeat-containing protein [Actinobacteria bacterium]|nr:VCBS repeat-containing protein [Actinomycetota bacterium]